MIALERVERLQKEFEIQVEWKGLEIHPEFPALGQPRSATGQRYAGSIESMRRLAAEAGVDYRPPQVMANTHLALAAAEYAREAGLFEPFHGRLFRAYFQEDQNISEPSVLLGIAREAGLDEASLQKALASDSYESRLIQARQEAAQLQLDGVPTFLMKGLRVVGAQPYEVLAEMVERAGARRRPQAR